MKSFIIIMNIINMLLYKRESAKQHGLLFVAHKHMRGNVT